MRRPRLRVVLVVLAALAGAVAVVVVAGDGGDGDPAERPDEPPAGDERGERGREGEEERGRERDGGGPAEPIGDGTVSAPRGRLIVGMSDQKTDFFGDPRFRRLGIRQVRLVVPWDAALGQAGEQEAWLREARGAGLEPLVVFNHSAGARCPDDPCRAPSPARFEAAFAAFRERWPWVRTFSTWNEPNHLSQPVARRPELVAGYWRAIRARCRGCTVLAADVVADASAPRFVRGFRRAAAAPPRIWGVHNYSDANRFRSDGTRRFLDLVGGEVWITETGGIVRFTTADGRAVFRYDERRAARATRQMLRLARSDPRIDRLYVYHWNDTRPPGRFDAGLIGADGDARPAYAVLRDALAGG